MAEIARSRGLLAEAGGVDPDRVRATHPDGTDLVELEAHGATRAEARSLAERIAAALVADADGSAARRAARVEAELRPRVEQLTAAIAEVESTAGSLQSAATLDRLRALRGERAAFQQRIADAALRTAQERVALSVVAPASVDPDPVRPRRALTLFGGVLLGLVAGLGTALLVPRRPGPAPAAGVARDDPPEQAAGPEAEPGPELALVGPAPGTELDGAVELVARAGVPVGPILFLLSDGGADWQTVAVADGEDARAVWAPSLPPGTYWLCAQAADASGRALTSDPVPVAVPGS